MLTIRDLRDHVATVPRVSLGHLPTPLEELPRMSEELGVKIFIKRDDCTGLAFGGNKTRHLEFTIGAAVSEGCDTIVQGAASQSNHCRQTAAACAKLGLDCHLLLVNDERRNPVQGNLLLDHLLGANVHWFDGEIGEPLEAEKKHLANKLAADGKKPYVLTPPNSTTLGAIAFANAFCELYEQIDKHSINPETIFVSSAGATQAGLILGKKTLGSTIDIIGIAPIKWDGGNDPKILSAARNAASHLHIEIPLDQTDVKNDTSYIGQQYGIFTEDGKKAMELLSHTEGIILDPGYTAKAFAGLINYVHKGFLDTNQPLLFWHTGGTPALFSYANEFST